MGKPLILKLKNHENIISKSGYNTYPNRLKGILMNTHTQRFITIGAVMMALSVAIGAFGAHALKPTFDAYSLAIFNTGVEYQFYHSLGLLAIALILHVKQNTKIKLAGYIMLGSILIFSGSLYILAVSGIKWLGAITPIGGSGFIVAWILLALGVKR